MFNTVMPLLLGFVQASGFRRFMSFVGFLERSGSPASLSAPHTLISEL